MEEFFTSSCLLHIRKKNEYNEITVSFEPILEIESPWNVIRFLCKSFDSKAHCRLFRNIKFNGSMKFH